MITRRGSDVPLRVPERVIAFSKSAVANPYVAYTAIVALQLRVLWNIWRYADLTGGDTSSYYVNATSWVHGWHENIWWSPLYTAIWGSILDVVRNLYASMVIQRMAVVFAATLLVLAIMRAIVDPALALFVAAWWAVVPANFDPFYEVHLYGALPFMIGLVVIARMPRREGIGITIGILVASAIFFRNELLVDAAFLAVAALIYEVREIRSGRGARGSAYLRAYLVPIAIACVLIGATYAMSEVQGSQLGPSLTAKEQLNFCEDYAAGFQEANPSLFVGNDPMSGCAEVLEHVFHRPSATLVQAFEIDPRAIGDMVLWNVRQLPGGLQVSVFGATAFANDPGFVPVTEHSTYALVLSLVLAVILIVGLVIAGFAGNLSLRRASPRKRWMVVAFGSVGLADLLVVLFERPWSEYEFGLAVCLLALTGFACSALFRKLGVLSLLAPISLASIIVLLAAFPTFYRPGPRPIYEEVQNLQMVRAQLQRAGSTLVDLDGGSEVCNYLSYDPQNECTETYWPVLEAQVTSGTSLTQVLASAHATVVYANSVMLADPLIAKLVAAPQAEGWRQIAHGSGVDGPWSVLTQAG